MISLLNAFLWAPTWRITTVVKAKVTWVKTKNIFWGHTISVRDRSSRGYPLPPATQAKRRQIVKRFNKMEQNDISLRLCQVLMSKEFDAYLPLETGRNKSSYPRGIYFSFIQTAGQFGIWGKLKANWELNESHELNSEYYWMCYIK